LLEKKLIAEKVKGGINIFDLKTKMETCRVEKAKHLAYSSELDKIWKKWAVYNLFYKTRHITIPFFQTSFHSL